MSKKPKECKHKWDIVGNRTGGFADASRTDYIIFACKKCGKAKESVVISDDELAEEEAVASGKPPKLKKKDYVPFVFPFLVILVLIYMGFKYF